MFVQHLEHLLYLCSTFCLIAIHFIFLINLYLLQHIVELEVEVKGRATRDNNLIAFTVHCIFKNYIKKILIDISHVDYNNCD